MSSNAELASAATAAAKIIEEAPFAAASMPALVKYLDLQIQHGAVDSDANRCLVKLCQLHPAQCADAAVLARALTQALTNMPLTDFVDQYSLLSEEMKATAPIAALAQLHAALDACQFAQFWTLAAAEPARSLVAAVPNFAVAVRRFVASVLVIAYRTMAADALAAALNLPAGGAEFNAWVAAENAAANASGNGNGNTANVWAVDAGTVRLPSVEENQARSQRAALEIISLQRVATLNASVFASS